VSGRIQDGFVPGRHLIDSFGNGGFRFAEMSHRGSILALPSGVRAWPVARPEEIDEDALAPVLAESPAIDLLIVGTGRELRPLTPRLQGWLREHGIRSDVMATGSAAQTYNILAAEERRAGAALIAVD
jgi:uncharacterized protein